MGFPDPFDYSPANWPYPCPPPPSDLWGQAPLSTYLHATACLLSSIFAISAYFWFNHVQFPINEGVLRLRTSTLSNSRWIVFFSSCGLLHLLMALRFSIRTDPQVVDWLTTASLVAHGVCNCLMTAALAYQKSVRGSPNAGDVQGEYFPDSRIAWRNKVLTYRLTCSALLGCYILAVIVHSTRHFAEYDWSFWCLFAFSLLLYSPPLFLGTKVYTKDLDSTEGPHISARVLLLLSLAVGLPFVAPISFWNGHIFTSAASWSRCPFDYAGWYDLFVALRFVQLAGFFVFMRMEFSRNAEQEMFNYYRQCQDSVDFRHAY